MLTPEQTKELSRCDSVGCQNPATHHGYRGSSFHYCVVCDEHINEIENIHGGTAERHVVTEKEGGCLQPWSN